MMEILLKCAYPNRTEIYYGLAFTGGHMFLNAKRTIGNDGRILSNNRVSMKNKLPPYSMPIMFRR